MTPQELEVVVALRKAHGANYLREHRAKKRAKDPEAYRANDRVMKHAWAAKNRDQVNATAGRVRANALASKRFHCEPCGQSLQSQHALDKHLASFVHLDCLAGKSHSSTLSLGAMNVKAKRAADKAAGLYRECIRWIVRYDLTISNHNKR
jgi:hypothetical protein